MSDDSVASRTRGKSKITSSLLKTTSKIKTPQTNLDKTAEKIQALTQDLIADQKSTQLATQTIMDQAVQKADDAVQGSVQACLALQEEVTSLTKKLALHMTDFRKLQISSELIQKQNLQLVNGMNEMKQAYDQAMLKNKTDTEAFSMQIKELTDQLSLRNKLYNDILGERDSCRNHEKQLQSQIQSLSSSSTAKNDDCLLREQSLNAKIAEMQVTAETYRKHVEAQLRDQLAAHEADKQRCKELYTSIETLKGVEAQCQTQGKALETQVDRLQKQLQDATFKLEDVGYVCTLSDENARKCAKRIRETFPNICGLLVDPSGKLEGLLTNAGKLLVMPAEVQLPIPSSLLQDQCLLF